jgi:hypothetical protein
MLEIGENLPLETKTPQHFVSIGASFNYFDRDTLLKLPVGTLGKIDRAHPAPPDFSYDGVRADSFANPVAFAVPKARRCELCEFFKGRGIAGEELFSFTQKGRVIGTRSPQNGRAVFA